MSKTSCAIALLCSLALALTLGAYGVGDPVDPFNAPTPESIAPTS